MKSQRGRLAPLGSWWIAVAGAAWLWSPVVRADEVALIPGSTIKQAIGGKVRGQIVSETSGGVVVQVGGAGVTVPIDQIASVRYDGQPASIQLAEIRESAGQLEDAVKEYQKAAADAANRPFILQEVRFREARALAELSLVESRFIADATAKLQKFVQTYPKARQLGPARSELARLYLKAGDYAAANREITELAKLPGDEDRAAVLKTTVLRRQGKYQESITELDRLIAKFPENSVSRRSAQLAKAESLAGLKKFDEAEKLVREVIEANPPENAAVQAPAYNTLGDCLREANRPKDALIAYLHTDLLYAKNKEEHPRALYQISQLFRRLKQDSRADEVWNRLKHDYPRSSWLTANAKP